MSTLVCFLCSHQGDYDEIVDAIMCAREEDRSRFEAIVQVAASTGELELLGDDAKAAAAEAPGAKKMACGKGAAGRSGSERSSSSSSSSSSSKEDAAKASKAKKRRDRADKEAAEAEVLLAEIQVIFPLSPTFPAFARERDLASLTLLLRTGQASRSPGWWR